MKKLVLVLTVVLVLSGIFAVAALTQVEIDRDITARIASDTHDNVAVKFTIGTGYDGVATVDGTSGEISFGLGGVLTDPGNSFNTEAKFTIGDEANRVFSITNQTNQAIEVTVITGTAGGVSLMSGGFVWTDGDEIGTGDEVDFYFELDTAGIAAAAPVDAEYTLQIRLAD